MPKKLERALERRADKLGLKGARRDAYVYGTLNKIKEVSKRGRGSR